MADAPIEPGRWDALLGAAIVAAAALAAWAAVRWPLRWTLRAISARTPMAWDDVLFGARTVGALALLAGALGGLLGATWAPLLPRGAERWLPRLLLALVAIAAVRLVAALLAAGNAIYERHPVARERPIKGLVQTVTVLAWCAGAIVAIAALLDRSPWYLLSGLGAATALLLLIFRDTILSLVAGIQLTTNRLVRVGDWLDMPQFGADGEVIDLALTTVLVRNWDNTLTAIPAHLFLSHAFRNWRGMQESGARRIKRSIALDLASVRHLDDELLAQLRRIQLLRPYLDGRAAEIAAWNTAHGVDAGHPVNGRRMTNLGCFRAYAHAYLAAHPRLRHDLALMVRHLQPGPEGLPLEIYCFTDTTIWAEYEAVQADIIDHLVASAPHFGLRLFQRPTGADLRGAAAAAAE